MTRTNSQTHRQSNIEQTAEELGQGQTSYAHAAHMEETEEQTARKRERETLTVDEKGDTGPLLSTQITLPVRDDTERNVQKKVVDRKESRIKEALNTPIDFTTRASSDPTQQKHLPSTANTYIVVPSAEESAGAPSRDHLNKRAVNGRSLSPPRSKQHLSSTFQTRLSPTSPSSEGEYVEDNLSEKIKHVLPVIRFDKDEIGVKDYGYAFWCSDEHFTNCYRCGVQFGILTRKHHCRVCGKIYCNACSSLMLPNELIYGTPRTAFASPMVLPLGSKKESRVCILCFQLAQDIVGKTVIEKESKLKKDKSSSRTKSEQRGKSLEKEELSAKLPISQSHSEPFDSKFPAGHFSILSEGSSYEVVDEDVEVRDKRVTFPNTTNYKTLELIRKLTFDLSAVEDRSVILEDAKPDEDEQFVAKVNKLMKRYCRKLLAAYFDKILRDTLKQSDTGGDGERSITRTLKRSSTSTDSLSSRSSFDVLSLFDRLTNLSNYYLTSVEEPRSERSDRIMNSTTFNEDIISSRWIHKLAAISEQLFSTEVEQRLSKYLHKRNGIEVEAGCDEECVHVKSIGGAAAEDSEIFSGIVVEGRVVHRCMIDYFDTCRIFILSSAEHSQLRKEDIQSFLEYLVQHNVNLLICSHSLYGLVSYCELFIEYNVSLVMLSKAETEENVARLAAVSGCDIFSSMTARDAGKTMTPGMCSQFYQQSSSIDMKDKAVRHYCFFKRASVKTQSTSQRIRLRSLMEGVTVVFKGVVLQDKVRKIRAVLSSLLLERIQQHVLVNAVVALEGEVSRYVPKLSAIANNTLKDKQGSKKRQRRTKVKVLFLYGFLPKLRLSENETGFGKMTLRRFLLRYFSRMRRGKEFEDETFFSIEDTLLKQVKNIKDQLYSSLVILWKEVVLRVRFSDLDALGEGRLRENFSYFRSEALNCRRKACRRDALKEVSRSTMRRGLRSKLDFVVLGGFCSVCNKQMKAKKLPKLVENMTFLSFIKLFLEHSDDGIGVAHTKSDDQEEGTAVTCTHVLFRDYVLFFEYFGRIMFFEPQTVDTPVVQFEHAKSSFSLEQQEQRLSNFRSKKHKRLKDWLDNVSEPRDELAPEVSSAKIKFKMLPSQSSILAILRFLTELERLNSERFKMEKEGISPKDVSFVVIEETTNAFHCIYASASTLLASFRCCLDVFEEELKLLPFYIGLGLSTAQYRESLSSQLPQVAGQPNSSVTADEEQLLTPPSKSSDAPVKVSFPLKQFMFSSQESVAEDDSASSTGNITCEVVCHFALKFQSLRSQLFNVTNVSMEDKHLKERESFQESLLSCRIFNSSGGKTNADFFETVDQRFIVKKVSGEEVEMFKAFAKDYFPYMADVISGKKKSCLLKIVGLYSLAFSALPKMPQDKSSPYSSKQAHFMVMEKLNASESLGENSGYSFQLFDLKGNMRNRYVSSQGTEASEAPGFQFPSSIQRSEGEGSFIKFVPMTKENQAEAKPLEAEAEASKKKQETGKEQKVLLDVNFFEYFEGCPFILKSREVRDDLLEAIENDTQVLAKSGIVDYSLLLSVPVQGEKREKQGSRDTKTVMSAGIVDYLQQYNYKKLIESNVKKATSTLEPTVVEPETYMKRFKKAMGSYFVA